MNDNILNIDSLSYDSLSVSCIDLCITPCPHIAAPYAVTANICHLWGLPGWIVPWYTLWRWSSSAWFKKPYWVELIWY